MTYSSEVLADSPLAYWRLGDAAVVAPTAATSSTNFSSEPPSNAIDGNSGTYWTTNGFSSGWLRLQFPSAVKLTTYAIRRRDDIPARNAKAWTFEGSNDGTAWTVLDTRTNITWPTAGETKSFSFANSTAFTYYRLNVSANNGDTYLSVAELSTSFLTDSSGNSRPMYPFGGVALGAAGLLDGDTDTAASFNGTTAYTRIPDYVAWMSPAAVTVEAIIKTTATGFRAIIDRDGVAARAFQFRLNSGVLEFITINGGAGVVTASGGAGLNDGVRHHVAATYDASNIRLYVDGVLVKTQAAVGALSAEGATLSLGANFSGSGASNLWTGTIDEAAYYGTALSGARITAHYAAIAGAPAGVTGTVAATAPAPTLTASGTVTRTGTVTATAPSPTLTVTGDALPLTTGTIQATAPAPSLTVDGTVAGVTSGTIDATPAPPTVAVTGTVPTAITGTVSATAPAPSVSVTDSTNAATVKVGLTVETGAVTLLRLVTLPGTEVRVGSDLEAGASQPVTPLPGTSVELGASIITRQPVADATDPRRRRPQWRYVITDLAHTPLGELTDIEHDPVEDGIGEPATMQFTIATDSDQHALIKPIERQCQVWEGDRLRLRGPILPGRASDDGTTITYDVHDPSWFWRDGRRVITRIPQKNLIRNGDFKHGLTWWTRGFDTDSIPKAAPKVVVVSEDFSDDTDGLDPIKAAEVTGVES
ncbi:MAG: hypothetical protein HOQ27_10690, partial [Dermatophilaceae bacterium]|nr:hypothetical protein [Dermatophilaceae bacterium]